MGLTVKSVGLSAVDTGLHIERKTKNTHVIALAGNPNVGKSTVFNALTGMNQHTGNWPGKTVSSAEGAYTYKGEEYILVDVPGTYSLMAHSLEEEVARDFICFGEADAVVVVCDATCLERNMNLVLQTLETTKKAVVLVNLMDEAQKKHIRVDLKALEQKLGVPFVGASAREGKGLLELMERIQETVQKAHEAPYEVRYSEQLENALKPLSETVLPYVPKTLNPRWVALKLLEGDEKLNERLESALSLSDEDQAHLQNAARKAQRNLKKEGIDQSRLRDLMVSAIYQQAEEIARAAVFYEDAAYNDRQLKIDRILTNKWTGIPIMLFLLAVVFWITISAANVPSELLLKALSWVGERMSEGLMAISAPAWLHQMLIDGIWRVLSWVVSVMLPPMAIFFPLFTLLEDLGVLPRIAFNLDSGFKRCCACGKQALTMCMGFGCNAAGVVGCRIIDSPRERLIAILTNNFVPCNGRFPTLIAILGMFFVGTGTGVRGSLLSALLLTLTILAGVLMTFLASYLLSKTVLKGVPSSFTLELPPYRRPQIGKVIVRSIFDRTLFVLTRAVAVAAPSGLLLWLAANITLGEHTLLMWGATLLDPFASIIGLDGVILIAFVLGIVANEIVLPIMLMAYLCAGSLMDYGSLNELHQILVSNGWTWVTAVCTMIFMLFHWPCSTTLWTVQKESGSLKWTFLSAVLPTAFGLILCFIVASVSRAFGLA